MAKVVYNNEGTNEFLHVFRENVVARSSRKRG